MHIFRTLRDADWLTEDRAQSYGRVFLVLQVVLVGFVAWAFRHESVTQGGGLPVGTDFIPYWTAAHMAACGHALLAYDDGAVAALERAHAWISADQTMHLPFLYPPAYLLLLLPLGLIGYVPASIAFLAAGTAVLTACLRRVLPIVWGWLLLILSPVMLLNAMIGQNGAWSAACFGGAMLFLQRRPALGGACLGLLVCKPHLAVAVPVVLLAARRWRALLACGATAAALCAASAAVFGGGAWVVFLQHARDAAPGLNANPDFWTKMQTVYSAVRLLHGSAGLAYGLQAATAVLALGVAGWAAWHRPPAGTLVAMMVAAGLLCPPYLFDYDLTCCLVPMAFLGAASLRDGWRAWEKSVLLALYAVPLMARLVLAPHGLPLVPPLLFVLLVLCARHGGEGRFFFFEKKKQKTFQHAEPVGAQGRMRGSTHHPAFLKCRQAHEGFFGAFVQKRTGFFLRTRHPC